MSFNWNEMQKNFTEKLKSNYEQSVQNSVNMVKIAQENIQDANEYAQELSNCKDIQQVMNSTNKYVKSNTDRTMSFVESHTAKAQEIFQGLANNMNLFDNAKSKK